MGTVHIGCSGYYYGHWKGNFYPPDAKSHKFFELYQEKFNTAEINSTFYHNPTEKQVLSWLERSKPGFCFSIKAPRFITHRKRFQDCKDPLLLFLHLIAPIRESDKLGAILFQSPPSLQFDMDVLKGFLNELPSGYRYTFEFRNREFYTEDVYKELASREMDFVWVSDPKGQAFEDVIAPFKYIRMHGSGERYSSNYSEDELRELARKIKAIEQDMYVYFNNDYNAYAPNNALQLIQLLKELK
jgi:uncharacterized protein YecE (DUF72 family)